MDDHPIREAHQNVRFCPFCVLEEKDHGAMVRCVQFAGEDFGDGAYATGPEAPTGEGGEEKDKLVEGFRRPDMHPLGFVPANPVQNIPDNRLVGMTGQVESHHIRDDHPRSRQQEPVQVSLEGKGDQGPGRGHDKGSPHFSPGPDLEDRNTGNQMIFCHDSPFRKMFLLAK